MDDSDGGSIPFLLMRAVDQSGTLVVVTDADGEIRYVNRGFEDITGFSRHEVVGRNIRLLKSGTQPDDTYRNLWETIQSRRTWRGLLHNRRKDGSLYWARATIDPVAGGDEGRPTYFIAMQEDVTREVTRDEALCSHLDRLEVLHELGHLALRSDDFEVVLRYLVDAVHRIVKAERVHLALRVPGNGLIQVQSGPDTGIVVNRKKSSGRSPASQYPGRKVPAPNRSVPPSGDAAHPDPPQDDAVITLPVSDLDDLFGSLSVTIGGRSALPIEDYSFLDAGTDILVAAIRRRAAEERIREMVRRDPLTGLPNRRLLTEKASDVLSQARRRGFQAAILFLDLDRFKEVNDSLGHAAGDELLTRMGRRLARASRRGETIARIGGDEFVVLMAPVSESEPEQAARRILRLLSSPFRIRDRTVRVCASIGIARFPEDGHTLDDLLKVADSAMYRVKMNGGGDCSGRVS